MIRTLLIEFKDYKFIDEKYMEEYFVDSGLDTTIFNKVKYVEIEMDDLNKKAYITFQNEDHSSLSERIEDDWYAIMDRKFKCIRTDQTQTMK